MAQKSKKLKTTSRVTCRGQKQIVADERTEPVRQKSCFLKGKFAESL